MVRATPAAMRDAVTITQSRTSWGLEIGHHRMAVTRMREARVVGRHAEFGAARSAVRPVWPLAIGTFASVSAFGLFVFGAVASEPLLPQFARYSLIVPVPARSETPVITIPIRHARKVRTAVPPTTALPAQDAISSGTRFEAADEPYVAKAMRTGELQEWLGADGQRRFLSAGAEQVDGDRHCRELALLVRRTDGNNQAYGARRCVAGKRGTGAADASTQEHLPSRAIMSDIRPVPPEPGIIHQSDEMAGL